MNEQWSLFLFGLVAGIFIGSITIYKWEEAASAAQLSKQIIADNRALKDMESRAIKAEGLLSSSKESLEQLSAERKKTHEKNIIQCKLNAGDVKWLHDVAATTNNLSR